MVIKDLDIENEIIKNIKTLMTDFYKKTNDKDEIIELTSAFLSIQRTIQKNWIPSKDIHLIEKDIFLYVFGDKEDKS